MKKEKQVKSYQRRTKSGKMVTVRAHTATYDAAEKAKEAAKKKGAGKELEERKKKPVQLEIPFGKEEEKKVLDEVKETAEKESSKKPAEKKTTKKVRPVGSGTNGPTPKRKSEGKATKSDKQTKAWFNSSPSSFSKVKVSKDKDGGWRIDLSDGSGQVYGSKEAAQKDAKLLRGMYKEWKGSSKRTKGSTPIKTSVKTTSASASSPAFTAAEFKEWYRGTGSAADKKVAKALRAQLGRAGYRKLEDEAIDNYSSRGHLSMFKRVSGGAGTTKEGSLTKMTLERKKAIKESMAREASNRRTEKAMRDEYAGKISSQQRAGIEKKEAKNKGSNDSGNKKYRTWGTIPDKLARNVAREEDFSNISEAKRYLQSLPDKDYKHYAKTYGKDTNPLDVLKGIKSGSRGVLGSDARAAKKFLSESSEYTPVKLQRGTLYMKGKTGYVVGSYPLQVRKASASDISEAKDKTSKKATTSKSETSPSKGKTI